MAHLERALSLRRHGAQAVGLGLENDNLIRSRLSILRRDGLVHGLGADAMVLLLAQGGDLLPCLLLGLIEAVKVKAHALELLLVVDLLVDVAAHRVLELAVVEHDVAFTGLVMLGFWEQ